MLEGLDEIAKHSFKIRAEFIRCIEKIERYDSVLYNYLITCTNAEVLDVKLPKDFFLRVKNAGPSLNFDDFSRAYNAYYNVASNIADKALASNLKGAFAWLFDTALVFQRVVSLREGFLHELDGMEPHFSQLNRSRKIWQLVVQNYTNEGLFEADSLVKFWSLRDYVDPETFGEGLMLNFIIDRPAPKSHMSRTIDVDAYDNIVSYRFAHDCYSYIDCFYKSHLLNASARNLIQ